MKKINPILWKLKSTLCFLSLISYGSLAGQMGPGAIQVSTGVLYTCPLPPGPGITYVFSCTSPNVTINNNPNNPTAVISVSPNETNCSIQLRCDAGTQTSGSNYIQDIVILPTINPISVVYPGEVVTATLHDNCNGQGLTCNYAYNWNVAPANCCYGTASPPSCNLSSSSTQVLVPTAPSLVPAAVTMNCNLNCVPTAPSVLTTVALPTVVFPVRLRTPVITGPTCLGCNGCPLLTGNITLSSNLILGAAYYNWNIVSGSNIASIVSGQGTQNIALNATGPGVVTVNVKAFTDNPSNNPVASSLYSNNFSINICCMSNLIITTNVNSGNTPDQEQAGINITASNNVSSGASAMYHAGSSVQLEPGFKAQAGSYFHGYLANCTGSYYRMAQISEEDSIINNSNNTYLNTPAPSNIAPAISVSPNNQLPVTISVFPNPTTGDLIIRTSRSQNMIITLEDISGVQLLQQKSDAEGNNTLTKINLENAVNGIYILKITDETGGLLKTDKIILNK